MESQATSARSGWSGDLWGGFATTLVALPSAIAFGVATFAALGPEATAQGALAGLVGAAVLGVVGPALGGTQALITAPCAPAAAVMGALAAGLAQGTDGAAPPLDRILVLMTLAALMSAALQVLYGALRGGTLIKFIPYPVVTGYMSGVGIVIFLKQLPSLLGLPKATGLWEGVASPSIWDFPGLGVGLAAIVGMALGPRLTRAVPPAILGLAAGVLAYLGLAALLPELRALEANHRVVGPIGGAGGSLLEALQARWTGLRGLGTHELRELLVPAATLSVLLSIDTLKTCVIVDALTQTRHRSNRELVAQGVANLASAIAGGVPGAGTSGATLVNIASGGRTRLSGIVEGVLVLVAYLALAPLVAWTPKPALAGILVVVAWRMFDRKAFRLLRHGSTRLDFGVSAVVIVVAVTVGLIQASGVGIALSIFLFIRDQVRSSVIRRRVYGNKVHSKQRRLPAEMAVLERAGDRTVVCELQHSLFFGTTDQLLTELDGDLGTRRHVILDLRRVDSVDFTAAHLLEQMEARLAGHGGKLLLSGLPPALPTGRNLRGYFEEVGLLGEGGRVLHFNQLSDALEWAEERTLEAEGRPRREDDPTLDLHDFGLFKDRKEETIQDLRACIVERSCAPGESVFRQGEVGDEVFLVRRGTVRIALRTKDGREHHLATVGRGDFFGDMAFLDRGVRSADAIASTPLDIYILSRERFDQVANAHPRLGQQVMNSLAKALADRLRHTDAELRALAES
ncbi:MAG: SLC26A/SulP transporter family protein [Planctomycetes bacterium]|nr:SLC26A/SulP transporter family protein [Planctomycetota bacterium]